MSLYQLNNVGFNYGTAFNLSGICLEIKPSTITAIVGPNGSGKTSFLNMLAFLNSHSDGTLIYKSNEVHQNNLTLFRKTVGYVQQSPYLLRGTVFKNIELGLKLQHVDKITRSNKVVEIMQLLGISELSNRIARTLSGGEAQKIAIGQVLALDPEVLILDEPFTHLDQDTIDEFENIIIELKEAYGKTIIFTTHDQYQAQRLANNVYSVIKGKVFESQIINLFSGNFDLNNHVFNTGKQHINLAEDVTYAENIAIDPKQIVLSNEKLDSSMQNSFAGKITGMTQENKLVKISVDAGEAFHVIVTHKALDELALSLGSAVWISFKSSSIVVF